MYLLFLLLVLLLLLLLLLFKPSTLYGCIIRLFDRAVID
jgi:hypothetical protein